ncbi:FAD-dependent oxidoreductase [Angustibacter peucedani]
MQPLVLVVSADARVEHELCADLRRRFGADYAVAGAGSAEGALTALAAHAPDPVALVVADEHLDDPGALELLARVRDVAPTAKRVLLVERGDWSSVHPVVAATAMGRADFHLYQPWRPLERVLYPAVAEMLAAWDRTQEAAEVPLQVVAEPGDPSSHELRDAMTRVGVPFWLHAPASDEGRRLRGAAGTQALPLLTFYDGTVLPAPSMAQVWQVLGMRTSPQATDCDVVVVGAGPAGLAAAVYGASEGLDTMVLEPAVPGGQAGTSSLIRNYLGFQRGVSGDDLANRAVEQAWLFGTDFVLTQAATALEVDGAHRVVVTSDGSRVRARAVVLATGVSWRRLGVPALEDLVGAGVFYGAAAAEARALQGSDVVVVGAGNSAGQAVMHLSRYARSVTMAVRGNSLRASMSEYLVSEVEQTPNVHVRLGTEVVDGHGSGRLEELTLRRRSDGEEERLPVSALFLLLGAEPHTDWLAGVVARDEGGFLLTGHDLTGAGPKAGSAAAWPLERPPVLLETSVPGVFAAGDVRHGSVKRVAGAAGEGATAIALVHGYLDDLRRSRAADRA